MMNQNQNQNQNETTINTAWIENLALEEVNMEESGVVNFHAHLNPNHLLEESSIQYMNELRDLFEIYITRFNEYRGRSSSTNQIKIFKISNTVNDFMLFRHSLRLIIARKSNDVISIGFLANGKEVFAARLGQNESFGPNMIHELRAHVGPFNNITWRFNGEIIDREALVRHYLSEFIVNSAR